MRGRGEKPIDAESYLHRPIRAEKPISLKDEAARTRAVVKAATDAAVRKKARGGE